MISQVAALSSPTSSIQNYANTVIADHEGDNYALENLATQYRVAIPAGITAKADIATARTVLAAVHTSSFDGAYLAAMQSINASSIASDGKLMTSTSNNTVLGYLEKVVTDDVSHLEAAKSLAVGTGTATFTATDAASVQTDFSGSNLEIELSQAVQPVVGASSSIGTYADMVITMHETVNAQLQAIAAANGVTLAPGVTSPADVKTAKQVLATSHSSRFSATYLNAMVSSHGLALGSNAMALMATSNASTISFLESYIPTVIMHQEQAKALLGFAPTLATNSSGALSGTSLSSGDAGVVTADLSGSSLELLISEIDQLTPGQTTSLAAQAVKSHQVDDYQLENLASKYGIALPVGISTATDVTDADTFLASVNTPQVKATYESVMVNINANDVAEDGLAISSATNADLRSVLENIVPDDVNHLEQARKLQIGGGNAAFLPSDQTAVQNTLSGSTLEIQLAQTDESNEANPAILSFSKMLASMHTMVNKQVLTLAAKNHVTLTPGVTAASDIATANTVDTAVGTLQFSTVYLDALASSHGVALGAQAMTIATTTDAGLIKFAEGYIPMVISHEEQAEALLTGVPAAKKV